MAGETPDTEGKEDTAVNSNNNNNNSSSSDLKRVGRGRGADTAGDKTSSQVAIALGLLGGLVALLMKSAARAPASAGIGAADPSLHRGMHGLQQEYDLVVVGAGLSGEQIAGVVQQCNGGLGFGSRAGVTYMDNLI